MSNTRGDILIVDGHPNHLALLAGQRRGPSPAAREFGAAFTDVTLASADA